MNSYFKNWEWIKDSTGAYSYARVVGVICIIANLIWLSCYGYSNINNTQQVIVSCSGFITSVLLWLIELFRDIKNISVKINGKEYSVDKDGDKGTN